jgi:hypothetical protein
VPKSSDTNLARNRLRQDLPVTEDVCVAINEHYPMKMREH